MKAQFQWALMVLVAAASVALRPMNADAQISTVTETSPQLAPGTAEILKLAQAKVGEDTIVAYIKGSGNSYYLNATQIIYLHQQGISDNVLTAMLNQPKAGQPMATPMPMNNAAQPSAAYPDYGYGQPSAAYGESAPATYYYSSPYYYPAYYYPGYSYGSWPY